MIFLLVPCFSGRTKTARALDLHWFSWKLVTVETVEAHCHWAQVAHAFGHPMGARLPGQECIICKSYASPMQVLCKSYASHNSAIAKNRNDLKDVAITKKQNLSPFWSIESYWVGRHWLYFPHSLARFARAHGTWPAENAIESAWSCDKGTGWKRFAAATDWIRLDHLSFDVAWMNIKSMYNIV